MIPRSNRSIFWAVACLTAWFSLAFVSLPNLVDSWFVEDGIWVWISVGFWAHFPVILFLYYKDFKYTDWILLSVLIIWGVIQYESHWLWFFKQPDHEKLTSYFQTFDFWYLLPKPEGRIVPDAYHTILHILMIGTFGVWLRHIYRKLR